MAFRLREIVYDANVSALNSVSHAVLFLHSSFLGEGDCRALCEELAGAAVSEATVVRTGQRKQRYTSRKTKKAVASIDSVEAISSALSELKSNLERHFGARLGKFENPQFLAYDEGDYFKYHFDGLPNASGPDFLRRRIVSVVLFLNEPSDGVPSNGFSGGSLTFCGLEGRKETRSLVPETGLLVAFPSRVRHKVEPITHGRRYSVVSWFPSAL